VCLDFCRAEDIVGPQEKDPSKMALLSIQF
jgi:hypothetical protein